MKTKISLTANLTKKRKERYRNSFCFLNYRKLVALFTISIIFCTASNSQCSIFNVSTENLMCNGSDFEFDISYSANNLQDINNTVVAFDITNGVQLNNGSTSPLTISIPNSFNSNLIELVLFDPQNYTCISDLISINPFNCSLPGCTDVLATNYNPNATGDDGSCTFQNNTNLDTCYYITESNNIQNDFNNLQIEIDSSVVSLNSFAIGNASLNSLTISNDQTDGAYGIKTSAENVSTSNFVNTTYAFNAELCDLEFSIHDIDLTDKLTITPSNNGDPVQYIATFIGTEISQSGLSFENVTNTTASTPQEGMICIQAYGCVTELDVLIENEVGFDPTLNSDFTLTFKDICLLSEPSYFVDTICLSTGLNLDTNLPYSAGNTDLNWFIESSTIAGLTTPAHPYVINPNLQWSTSLINEASYINYQPSTSNPTSTNVYKNCFCVGKNNALITFDLQSHADNYIEIDLEDENGNVILNNIINAQVLTTDNFNDPALAGLDSVLLDKGNYCLKVIHGNDGNNGAQGAFTLLAKLYGDGLIDRNICGKKFNCLPKIVLTQDQIAENVYEATDCIQVDDFVKIDNNVHFKAGNVIEFFNMSNDFEVDTSSLLIAEIVDGCESYPSCYEETCLDVPPTFLTFSAFISDTVTLSWNDGDSTANNGNLFMLEYLPNCDTALAIQIFTQDTFANVVLDDMADDHCFEVYAVCDSVDNIFIPGTTISLNNAADTSGCAEVTNPVLTVDTANNIAIVTFDVDPLSMDDYIVTLAQDELYPETFITSMDSVAFAIGTNTQEVSATITTDCGPTSSSTISLFALVIDIVEIDDLPEEIGMTNEVNDCICESKNYYERIENCVDFPISQNRRYKCLHDTYRGFWNYLDAHCELEFTQARPESEIKPGN